MGEATRRRNARFAEKRRVAWATKPSFIEPPVLVRGRRHAGLHTAALALLMTQAAAQLVVSDRRPRHKPDKGKKGGSCNREACQAPGATWYNRGSLSYYCASCARMLSEDPFNKREAERLFGGPLCVEEV